MKRDPFWLRLLFAVAGTALALSVGGIFWAGSISARVDSGERQDADMLVRLIRIEDSVAAIYRMMIERRE